jgi:hypothetical protein
VLLVLAHPDDESMYVSHPLLYFVYVLHARCSTKFMSRQTRVASCVWSCDWNENRTSYCGNDNDWSVVRFGPTQVAPLFWRLDLVLPWFPLMWKPCVCQCRFFTPTILFLKSKGHRVHILCMSLGKISTRLSCM